MQYFTPCAETLLIAAQNYPMADNVEVSCLSSHQLTVPFRTKHCGRSFLMLYAQNKALWEEASWYCMLRIKHSGRRFPNTVCSEQSIVGGSFLILYAQNKALWKEASWYCMLRTKHSGRKLPNTVWSEQSIVGGSWYCMRRTKHCGRKLPNTVCSEQSIVGGSFLILYAQNKALWEEASGYCMLRTKHCGRKLPDTVCSEQSIVGGSFRILYAQKVEWGCTSWNGMVSSCSSCSCCPLLICYCCAYQLLLSTVKLLAACLHENDDTVYLGHHTCSVLTWEWRHSVFRTSYLQHAYMRMTTQCI